MIGDSPLRHDEAGSAWSRCWARTVVDLVNESCLRSPDLPVIYFEDGLVITRRDLLDSSERLAGYLKDYVKPGERVAVMVGNRAEYMTAWLGVIAVRAVFVSVNPQAKAHDAGHILRDSKAVLLITEESQRPLIEAMRENCPDLRCVIWLHDAEPHGFEPYLANTERLTLRESEVQRTDVMNVYYTSGTTGSPKGCMLDHQHWLRAVDVDLRLHAKGPDDRILCCLQFYYQDPALLLLIALQAGASIVAMRRFSVSRFWDVVRRFDVTEILGVGAIPVYLLRAEPNAQDRIHKVERALQVGIPASIHRDLNERWGFPWVDGYGITESGYVARVPLAYASEMAGSGSMGVPCPEVRVRVVDPAGRDRPVGEVGEVLVKAPGMMVGYLDRPNATAEAFRNGWLHTGDLATQDERGFLYFKGRIKDIIRRSGENISAEEVETVLRSHPGIDEAAVIPVPDSDRGEEIKAFIRLADGESPESVTRDDILTFCSERLGHHKIPRYIEYRTDFPRTPSMRVAKHVLRDEGNTPYEVLGSSIGRTQ